MKKLILIVTLVAGLAGCAGTQFNWDDVRKIRVGMTEAELVQAMGSAPNHVSAQADRVIYVWSYANSFSGVRTASVILKDGKVISAPPVPEQFK